MRRPWRWLALAASAIVSLELASLVAGTLVSGPGFVSTARRERARLAGLEPAGGAGGDPASLAGAEALPPGSALESFALHPYLGFVADPASRTGPLRDAEGRLEATDLGFFRRAGSRAEGASLRAEGGVEGAPLRVGVLGGSVAFLFSLAAQERLETELARLLDLGPGGVVVESYALPGHKQPQQLYALAYLLLLGRAPDVVVNVDGFNEVALPIAENVPQGTAAFYPRSWGRMIRGAGDAGALQEAARVVAWREARAAAARGLSGPLLDRSPTVALLWELADAATTDRIDAAESELRQRRIDGGGYAATGPPPGGAARSELLGELAEVWRRSSLLMQQLCEANGIAYVHVLQPNQYLPGAKVLTAEEERVAYDAAHPYRAAVEDGYPLLIEAGQQLRAGGVAFADLSLVYAGVAEAIFVDTCCHVNRRGNEILADRIAEQVAQAVPRPLHRSGASGRTVFGGSGSRP